VGQLESRRAAQGMLRRLYEYKRKPTEKDFYPVDITTILSMDGWSLRSLHDLRERSTPISGRVYIDEKIIFVNSDDPEGRWRFTVAHELGHIVMKHRCKYFIEVDREGTPLRGEWRGPRAITRPDVVDGPDLETARLERSANAFAAELLMPERAVRRRFKDTFGQDRLWTGSTEAQVILGSLGKPAIEAAELLGSREYNNLSSLASYFSVSREAMKFRLMDLQMVY